LEVAATADGSFLVTVTAVACPDPAFGGYQRPTAFWRAINSSAALVLELGIGGGATTVCVWAQVRRGVESGDKSKWKWEQLQKFKKPPEKFV
jgi:hypothetical protein